MPYLIDGNNLIGHIPSLDLKDQASRKLLVSRLQIFQEFKKTRVIVVFDGPPDPDISEGSFKDTRFRVCFPPFSQTADNVIEEIVCRQTDLRQFFVVSSDLEIKNFARSKGAKPLDCSEFIRRLKAALKKYDKIAEMDKNTTPPSPLEVTIWSDIFKGK